ncbi:MAG: peptidoglycan DD-metalloendopeptidase family protein [Bacteroidota bacterium]|nr:peptidoglycan DD-metalloendopeptidase family protein [Bacteroidota bacterium]
MSTKGLFVSLLTLFLVAISLSSFSQSKKEKLRNDKIKIEREIKLTSNLLNETKKSKKVSINQIVLLNKKISQRKRLINSIDEEVAYLNNAIVYNKNRIKELEHKLELMKKEYASMVQAAYRNKNSINRLMYIFASDNFDQAFKRIKYFQQYSEYRQKQSEMILSTKDSIRQKNEGLRYMRDRNVSLKNQNVLEKQKLNSEKKSQNRMIKKFSSKEKQLLATLRKNERAAKRLQNAIEKIIAEEIAKSNVNIKSDKKVIKKTFNLTPRQSKLSANFVKNRGKLPWPSERGIISSTYGEHPHPVLKYIKVKNNGIDILTPKGSSARSVFDGIVTNIISIPNQNLVVIVRHGEFLSVYSNLEKIFVEVEQEITAKTDIGSIFTDPQTHKTELHFEIWKGKTLRNPAYWLAK